MMLVFSRRRKKTFEAKFGFFINDQCVRQLGRLGCFFFCKTHLTTHFPISYTTIISLQNRNDWESTNGDEKKASSKGSFFMRF